MRAEKLGKRARQAGMDWTDIHAVLAKVREEMDEVEGALARNDPDAAAEELGDMLLALLTLRDLLVMRRRKRCDGHATNS
jgi:ATP diphosphatase